MKRSKKFLYISFTGVLTSLAISACYWQTIKFMDSRQRWSLIAKQLSSSHPQNIAQMTEQQKLQLYPFKYVKIPGFLSDQFAIVTRPRGMRTGYLVLRKLFYKDQLTNTLRQIIALDGWCPSNWNLQNLLSETSEQCFSGILRKKQSADFLHNQLKQSDLQKYKMNTWIDLEKYLKEFKICPDAVNKCFYLQILKPVEFESSLNQSVGNQPDYPYRYSVDNFQLPYLTPDKHKDYATFWFFTSLVGLAAILKVFHMK